MTGRGVAILALVVTLAVSLLYVRARFLLVELSIDVSENRAEKVKLEQEKRSLTLELATLKSPRRIERVAADTLGLERTHTPQSTVVVDAGSR